MLDRLDIEFILAVMTVGLFAFWARPPKDTIVNGALAHWLESQRRAPRFLLTIAICLIAERLLNHHIATWAAKACAATTLACFFLGYSQTAGSFWSKRRNRFIGFMGLSAIWTLFFLSNVRSEAYYLFLSAPIFSRSITDRRQFIKSNLQDIEALKAKAYKTSLAANFQSTEPSKANHKAS